MMPKKDREELNEVIRQVEVLRHELLTMGEELYNAGFKQEGRTLSTLGNKVDDWVWNCTSKMYRR